MPLILDKNYIMGHNTKGVIVATFCVCSPGALMVKWGWARDYAGLRAMTYANCTIKIADPAFHTTQPNTIAEVICLHRMVQLVFYTIFDLFQIFSPLFGSAREASA